MTGKYSSKRDEVLDAMAQEGWATASDGDVNEFGAWFAYMSNGAQDVALNNGEFVSLFESMDFGFELTPELSAELVGNFVIVCGNSGMVNVVQHDTLEESRGMFQTLESMYHGFLEGLEES